MSNLVKCSNCGELVVNRESVQRGDVIRYLYEQPGSWRRYFTAMVTYVADDELFGTSDRGEKLSFTPKELVGKQVAVIFRTSEDELVAKGEIRFKDMTRKELEELPDATKEAIRRKEKAAQAKVARREEERYRDDLFAKNAKRQRNK